MRWIVFLSCFLSACSSSHYNYQIEGAQEFVLESYQISQGKKSILELEGKSPKNLNREYLEEYEDVIDEDDLLNIVLFDPMQNDLICTINQIGQTVGYRVMKGMIYLPHLKPVYVKGMTLTETREEIQRLYSQEIENVSVFIDYAQRLHSKVELIGAVKNSEVLINGKTRLYEVLSLAGIASDTNLFKSYVVRSGEILPVDFYKLVHEGDMCQNIVMRPKDKIFIADPMASKVMVMGEVGMNTLVPVPSGYISLREAIAAAGGIPFTGDKRCILVIRGNAMIPKIYRLSWNHITFLPNDSLLLVPGDTVYISERPITKWNRFIEQLLPSSFLIDLGIRTKGLFY
ncbi:MAG: polysaccharide biosynthesis/export family protein [Chlamydiales bacterium]